MATDLLKTEVGKCHFLSNLGKERSAMNNTSRGWRRRKLHKEKGQEGYTVN